MVSLPIHPLRLRGFRVLQSISVGKPRKLMAYFLPVRPWLSLDLLVFGFQLPALSLNTVRPLLHFDATVASWPVAHCSSLLAAPVDVSKPKTQAPCLSFPTLQHFRYLGPFFSPHLLMQRLANVAVFPRSPVPRVWLPFRRCQPPNYLGSLFQLPTLLGFALQSFHPIS
jgi:hypothetical protein